MDGNKGFPKSASLFLWLLQIFGRFLISIFLLSLGISLYACPFLTCRGESAAVGFLPFMAFFTVLPLGLILTLSTRKGKGEDSYGSKSMARLSGLLFALGLFFILAFLMQLGVVVMNCSTLACVSMLYRVVFMVPIIMIIPFVNFYTALPIGILFIFLSKKAKALSKKTNNTLIDSVEAKQVLNIGEEN